MDVDHLKINITQSVTEVLNYSTDAIKKPTYMFMYTVPDRSNLTGNALLERKWNAKWNAARTPKFLWSWSAFRTRTHSIENAITPSIENAITRSIENLWLA